jgi:hypothetical protein
MFTLPAMANALFETRGLAFGGGPFRPALANDIIYLLGWPPIIAVHILFGVATFGIIRYLRENRRDQAD